MKSRSFPQTDPRGPQRLTGEEFPDGIKRGIGLVTIRATRLRHVRPSAPAFAANFSSGHTNQVDRRHAVRQVGGYANRDAGLAFIDANKDGDA